jgi:glycosyltransferase involved in cell wall biosynthesis
MTRYRIAFLFPSIHRGGAEQVLFNITRGLQKLGHHVSYYSFEPPHIELEPDLPTVYVPENPRFSSWQIKRRFASWKIKERMEEDQRNNGRFDLILSNYGNFRWNDQSQLFYFLHVDLWATLKLKYPDYPNDCSFRRYLRVRIRLWRTHLHYRNKNVIAVSKGAETALLKNIKARPHYITTIYNPYDFELIQQHLMNAYKPDIHEPYIVHVGRFAPQKRHDLLFDAYRRLNNPPRLVLLAKVSEGLTSMIAQYGLTDRIILAGLHANPFPWIKQAKAMVLSSDYEALPGVLIESLICGTPAVSTNCPSGPSEILTGELAHWLVPLNDPVALANKIQEVLDHPYTISRDQIKQFDINVLLPKYLELIKTQ